MTFSPKYKCRACRGRFTTGAETVNPSKSLPLILNDMEPFVPMITYHQCSEFLFGVADLIGMESKDK